MKTTVKRALWQRTLETAGPLRKPLPQAPSQEMESFFCRMQAIVDRGEERRRQQAKRAQPFGVDFAAGGVRDQTGVCLVGERGPEITISITVDARPLETALAQWQRDLERAKHDLQTGGANFWRAMQAMQVGILAASKTMARVWVKQMVGEINDAAGGCDGDVSR